MTLPWIESLEKENMPISLLDAAIHNLGPCAGVDGFDCPEPATIHHLDSEEEYCERHYSYMLRQGYIFDPYQFGSLVDVEVKEAWGWWRNEVIYEMFLYDWLYEFAIGAL